MNLLTALRSSLLRAISLSFSSLLIPARPGIGTVPFCGEGALEGASSASAHSSKLGAEDEAGDVDFDRGDANTGFDNVGTAAGTGDFLRGLGSGDGFWYDDFPFGCDGGW